MRCCLALLLLLFACGAWAQRLGEFRFDSAKATDASPIQWNWQFGDRTASFSGIELAPGGTATLSLPGWEGGGLTLKVREFRTNALQSPAYLIELNDKPLVFRCEALETAGPATAFIDLPVGGTGRPFELRFINLAPHSLCLDRVVVYHDLEAYVKEAGMALPMALGPTVGFWVEPERLAALRALLPKNDLFTPLVSVPTFALAQWPPEDIKQRLEALVQGCAGTDLGLELQLNTWWAGTPSGPDGRGGHWYDPTYQQVTYDPEKGQYGLSVPNHWSSVPWLTTRNPRLNAFKARQFETTGRLLRELADSHPDLPLFSLVLDNEVTYWGAGMPDTPPNLQADFNPSLVQAATEAGIQLDPTDGLGPDELAFLQASLRAYNRETSSALLKGLGASPLGDKVYTHTFLGGWCFGTPTEALAVGVLEDCAVGGEWGGYATTAAGSGAGLPAWLKLQQELGLPANINCELGGASTAAGDTQMAYAAGCTHITLFNLSDRGLKATVESLASDHGAFPRGIAWRPKLLEESFQSDSWQDSFSTDAVHAESIWPTPDKALVGNQLGQSNVTRFILSASELLNQPTFDRLALRLRARAFVLNQADENAYMALRVIQPDGAPIEVWRMHDASGEFSIDLSEWAKGRTELPLELDLHPLGLNGWVCVFDLSVEEPWAEEQYLADAKPVSADRLRAESLLVAWRGQAQFELQRAEAAGVPEATLAEARQAITEGRFPEAVSLLKVARFKAQPDIFTPWEPPLPNRLERGELRSTAGDAVTLDPYDGGFVGRRITLSSDCKVTLVVNGEQIEGAGLGELLGGDDVSVLLEDGLAVQVTALRGAVTARVASFLPCTAFDLPRLELEGGLAMPISSVASLATRFPPERPASCPLVVGARWFEPGDLVEARWNPETEQFCFVKLLEQKP